MRRRDVLGTLSLGPLALTSEPGRSQDNASQIRVGILSGVPRTARHWRGFEERLGSLTRPTGRHVEFVYVDTRGQASVAEDGARGLVSRGVDILVAGGPELALRAALAASTTLPIVMIAVDFDPIARRYVDTLARPSGNVTGVFLQQIEVTVKRVELLRQAFPSLRAAGVFWDPISADQWHEVRERQTELGIQLAGAAFEAQPYDYEDGLSRLPTGAEDMLLVLASPVFLRDRQHLADLALRRRLRSAFAFRDFVEAGGLMSYGPSLLDLFTRAADYVHRLASGTPIAALPIEQPTRFELVLNLKTAHALGTALPTSLLARADEVIE